ncbi:hypothetical protein ABID21_004289 [Pseudorhizobium tarimense]|uniref:Uncharacterized protein n=1 Tax=Pseudorhizobium tarimense TaxID=1079109 RepID=A0ABV2HC74_9HYPH|nr:hypothetical protein [Pseudorhizobium tarimense]MCJ8521187.1 hypothetical protein [Pseudorhizobium tarimense]
MRINLACLCSLVKGVENDADVLIHRSRGWQVAPLDARGPALQLCRKKRCVRV